MNPPHERTGGGRRRSSVGFAVAKTSRLGLLLNGAPVPSFPSLPHASLRLTPRQGEQSWPTVIPQGLGDYLFTATLTEAGPLPVPVEERGNQAEMLATVPKEGLATSRNTRHLQQMKTSLTHRPQVGRIGDPTSSTRVLAHFTHHCSSTTAGGLLSDDEETRCREIQHLIGCCCGLEEIQEGGTHRSSPPRGGGGAGRQHPHCCDYCLEFPVISLGFSTSIYTT